MNEIKLSPRVLAAANMVRPSARLVDVGTDHAYLPVYLAQKGAISCALASDIAKGPIERAQAHIRAQGVENAVQTALSPGLEGAADFAPTDIVIAGMGGEMIVSIIEDAPFVRDPSISLILQPMSKQEILRAYLSREGFAILEERAALEDRRVYQILRCAYDGRPYTLSPLEAQIGPLLIKTEGKEVDALLEKYRAKLKKSLAGQRSAGREDEEEASLLAAIEDLQTKRKTTKGNAV